MQIEQHEGALNDIGRLLDQAVDRADAIGDSLLAAHIAQAAHCLERRVARLGAGEPMSSPPPMTADADQLPDC